MEAGENGVDPGSRGAGKCAGTTFLPLECCCLKFLWCLEHKFQHFTHTVFKYAGSSRLTGKSGGCGT